MKIRSFIPVAAVASLALAAGCSNDTPKGKPTGKTTGGAKSTATAKATGTAATKPAAATAKFGKGVIKGTVSFTGTAPEMKVPTKRKEAELCKDKDVVYNAVNVADGKLADVFVRIAPGAIEGEYEAKGSITIEQKDCMYSPRIQGALPEQEIVIKNADATLHNVNAGIGAKSLFNTAQPKGAADLKKSFEEPGIYRLKCDVHPWMRSFVIVAENPFYAVSGKDGSFSIDRVPDGKYKIEAWHSQYGKKESKEIEVKGGEVKVDFSYDGKEAEPKENEGELKGLW